MKAIIVGYGSIGQRHVRTLQEMDIDVDIVSHCHDTGCYEDIGMALGKTKPEYIVIANKTMDHYKTFSRLAGLNFKGTVLVEKPLFDKYIKIPKNSFSNAFVGYNLRFHPAIRKIKKILCREKAISFFAYVGQYLPQWRPKADYNKGYSASKRLGGGVLRDLSHELDYVNFLLGKWRRLTAKGGHFSDLEIDSDDAFSILMKTEYCPFVTVHMNYLDRIPRRWCILNTNKHTYRADLIKGTLETDDKVEDLKFSISDTYRLQHEAILENNKKNTGFLCSLKDGLEVMHTIEAVEKASKKNIWITR